MHSCRPHAHNPHEPEAAAVGSKFHRCRPRASPLPAAGRGLAHVAASIRGAGGARAPRCAKVSEPAGAACRLEGAPPPRCCCRSRFRKCSAPKATLSSSGLSSPRLPPQGGRPGCAARPHRQRTAVDEGVGGGVGGACAARLCRGDAIQSTASGARCCTKHGWQRGTCATDHGPPPLPVQATLEACDDDGNCMVDTK